MAYSENSNVCRTCLAKETELLSVFDKHGTVTLDYVVDFTTGVKIKLQDGLPSWICVDCKEQAVKAFHFKKKSLDADTKLRRLFKNEKRDKNFFEMAEVPVFPANTFAPVKIETTLDQEEVDNDCFDVNFTAEYDDYDNKETVKEESQNQDYNIGAKVLKISTQKKKDIKDESADSLKSFCKLCCTSYDGARNIAKHMRHHANLKAPKKRGRPKKLTPSSILTKPTNIEFELLPITQRKTSKTVRCVVCEKGAKTKEDLAFHLLKHTDRKIICCFTCKKMYLKKKHFDDHICGTQMCIDDANTSDTIENLEIQYTEVLLGDLINPNHDMENMNILLSCKACGIVLLSDEALAYHKEADHPESALCCSNCPKTFTTEKAALRHKGLCMQIDKTHVCNYCGLRFAFEISLNKHILRHHKGQGVSVKFLSTLPEESEPLEAETHSQAQYQCDTCQRSFTKKESLVKHTKSHMPIEKSFECDICQKKFSRKDNLRSHKKIHEPNREKAPNSCLCLYCGRGFSNSSNLIVHMRRHTGEKPYKCEFCTKGFPRSSDLQCHRRSHTGEKPCVCRVCGKGFSRSNKLSRHMRVHTGQKPYKCTYCDKAFSQSNDLTLHVRRHTGDKPYICEVCGDRFIQGSALQTHRRIHGHLQLPTPSTSTVTSTVSASPQLLLAQTQTITYAIQNITL